MTGTAWVIGGTGGIGGACARGLAEDGFAVHTSDRPHEDITQPGVADGVAAQLAAEGPITAAVHTIGMSGRRIGDGPVSTCTDEGWDEVLRVDLTSAFYFARACMNHCAPGASVVLIGSALAKGLDGDFLTAAYRVAKAGMIPLLEAAAYEGARKGIRFNIVSPGLVETRMAARALGDEQIIARFPELMPLTRRPATGDEVAAAVRWLAGENSVQTTGAVIPVDGGWLLR
ncbi:SDR family NAD(P)-dependent oxidoreductase [Microbacterium sp. DT81.1]|uniref:SDR family NAD(P)-dependent oxidoreductase n=1 Tax=Microbacterium sp. DT81.1 TaxID=3393413 RepID=UPI003CEE5B88